ncbi:MAG: hypothetical protein AAB913_03095 [Patescibacteria group bacterium]
MKKDNKLRWSEQFAFGENTPLIASGEKIKEMVMVIEINIKNIKKTKFPRHIILETWLVLDYFIRMFIVAGLNIDKYSTRDFDLAFELLPQSFKDCSDFLNKFIIIQSKLPIQIDAGENEVKLSAMFAFYIMKEHRDFYDKHFTPILKLYYKKYYPELVKTVKTTEEEAELLKENLRIFTPPPTFSAYLENFKDTPEYRSVSNNWLKIADNLVKSNFFKYSDQFNKARNRAMHVIKTEKMYQEFGINGKDEKIKFKQLKEKSINLLKLLDISIAKTKYKKFK